MVSVLRLQAMATAAEILIDSIADWGVDVVFGLPGDGINGIMEALRKRRDRVRFIQVRHEEAAAFMACAYAKYTGKLGVCLATSGPGGIHLLNGLYDAKLDGAPVLAITGLQFHDLPVPVSLVGTFVVFPALGFSINTLSLFGLVLAIGLVVDDAIVVVEAVEHHIEHGMTPGKHPSKP